MKRALADDGDFVGFFEAFLGFEHGLLTLGLDPLQLARPFGRDQQEQRPAGEKCTDEQIPDHADIREIGQKRGGGLDATDC